MQMTDNIYWVLELDVQAGALETFRVLMREMVAAAQREPGTLNYEWNISADGRVCHIYVRYRNGAAVMDHMASWDGNFSRRFSELATITRMSVYGAPDATVKAVLDPYGPVYYEQFGGFNHQN
jgi:quinol monooxygenase YgiN